MRPRYRLCMAFFTLLFFAISLQAQSAPVIASVSPMRGPIGTTVTIMGQNFGSTQGSSNVVFVGTANVNAPITSWSDTQIVLAVPQGASQPSTVYVQTSAGFSNGIYFTVGVFPTITNMDPLRGPEGTVVTATGQYFGATPGTVTFVGSSANVTATATSWSDTQVVFTVPHGAQNPSTVYIQNSVGGSNGIYFTVGAFPTITQESPQFGAQGTLVTFNGQYFGATQGAGFVTFAGSTNALASVQSWNDAQITVLVPPGIVGPSTIYIQNSAGSSNGVYFNVLPTPNISSLSATSGIIGSTVTINGSNFGGAQGSSTVTFGGTAATSIGSWSASQIVATIPAGATTGNIVVTAQGVPSNGVNFTVFTATPPSITASASPSPNSAGWNNGPVLVSFTCNKGALAIATCPAPQLITTEGANQAVSGTVTDSAGNSVSTSVTLNIERTPPTLTVSSPADQFVSSSASVTVSGTTANSLTNINSVACNGTVAATVPGSFSCNISLNPGVNLVMVTATDVAGNAAGTRLHVIYGAALSPALSLQITPANANVLVGATQQFTAVDQLGRPRTDVAWSVDNTSIATISTDSSPILTGVAAGTVNLTASLGSISVSIPVNVLAGTSLPVGTVLWSAPQIAGFTTQRIVQAVPTSNGTPDLYSIEQDQDLNTLVRAFTSDGRQLWQSSLGQFGRLGQAMGDNFGGLVLNNMVLDGQTGTTAFTLQYSPSAIGQDGSIYATGFDPATGSGAVFRLDPNSGQASQIFTAPIGINSKTVSDSPLPCEAGVSGTGFSPGSITSGIVVDANGTIWFGYQAGRTSSTNVKYCLNEPTDTDTSHTVTSNLASISTAGVLTTLQTGIDTQTCIANTYPATGGTCTGGKSGGPIFALIPDGNNGALIQFTDVGNNNQPMMQSTSSGSPYPAPLGGGSWVLGENNTAFLTNGSSVASFNPLTGSTNWTYQAASTVSFNISFVEPGNALVGKVTDPNGHDSIVEIDEDGNGQEPIPAGANASYSWKGAWTANYANTLSSLALPAMHVTWGSSWAFLFGNASSNGTETTNHSLGIFWCGTNSNLGEQVSCGQNGLNLQAQDISFSYAHQTNFDPTQLQDFSGAHPDWVQLIQSNALIALQKAFHDFPSFRVELGSAKHRFALRCIPASLKCTVPDQEHSIYVIGDWVPGGGSGFTGGSSDSFVYYLKGMTNAQQNGATGVSPNYPLSTGQDIADFQRLMQAIGTGLGNSGAHEVGHQLAFDVRIIMDCSEPGAQRTCTNGDNNVFEYYGAQPFQYTHIFPDIHWQIPDTVCAIHQYFNKKYRNEKEQCTSDFTR